MQVVTVIVTFNRLELLKKSISAVKGQSKASTILVVNNGSTDGTREWLEQQEGLTVLHQENSGGAGGFHAGIKAAYEAGADWVWLMDDDTIPEPNALETLLNAASALDETTGFLVSKVVWHDGQWHVMNKPPLHSDVASLDTLYSKGVVRVQNASFVSAMIHRRAIKACGLPIKEFFIWWDDVEYTTRIAEQFHGYLVPDSVVLHATKENVGADVQTLCPANAMKFFYGMRNRIYLILRAKEPRLLRWANVVVSFRECLEFLFQKLPLGMAIRLGLKLVRDLFHFNPAVVRHMDD